MTMTLGLPLLIAAVLCVLAILIHSIARARQASVKLDHLAGHKRLLVLTHGLTGYARFQSAIDLAREALPDSDMLTVNYDSRIISNACPYAIANLIERQIHEADCLHDYDEIVLIGHSLGGMLLRKTILWGNGIEDDRHDFGLKGVRPWIMKTSRFVSLAGINRGWSIAPRPKHMKIRVFLVIWFGERLFRLTRSGELIMALRRGAPFVADARVQWIDLCRNQSPLQTRVPQTIHLLGDRDDIVGKDDSMDLNIAANTIFVTLEGTGHGDIGLALRGGKEPADQKRREQVKYAIQGNLALLSVDLPIPGFYDLAIKRIVYVVHGIRDYGEWTDTLRDMIEAKAVIAQPGLAVVNFKYGHFPMLPFLLYWDRQKNVRLFMDEYTENRARYPHATAIDFIGHSNGTYILASALVRYLSIRVKNIYFAGSVVPKHFKWIELIESGRVGYVANIVASGDWVVAIFPRFFEQIGELLRVQASRGLLDIGSAGFRGFEDASHASAKIENFQFAQGAHSAGVDVSDTAKLDAIAEYAVTGAPAGLVLFSSRTTPLPWLALLSNASVFVWLVGILLLLCGGWGLFCFSTLAGWIYVLILLGVVNML
jgi:pimeloyl-ACP methyl ester carboxylesterase